MDRSRIRLSGRLSAIAELCASARAERPFVLCDVGCDHAHVPIRLMQDGDVSRTICMDILPGPLLKAKENLDRCGLSERCELLRSDGLDAYSAGSADVLLISGLGGLLISDILLREPEKTGSFSAVIVQPQSEFAAVRRALLELSFRIDEERFIEEDGKFYPVIRAVRWERAGREPETPMEEIGLLYGPVLLSRRDETLLRYLLRGRQKTLRILAGLPEREAGKREEMSFRLKMIDQALRVMGADGGEEE